MLPLQTCRACLEAAPSKLGRQAQRQVLQTRSSSAAAAITATAGPASLRSSRSRQHPQQQRPLHTTRACRDDSPGLLYKLIKRVPGVYNQTYRVYNYANTLYKSLAKQAPYKIDPNQRKKGLVRKAEDGEEIGEGSSPWHTELGLPPTFSTWAQVTMMHMYLAVVRYRCLPQDAFEGSQKSLVDAFFYEAEERMDVHHGMSSRSLRQHHLKDLFVAWRGLMLAYDEGIVRGDAVLGAAVWRNLFKGNPDVDVRKVAAVVSYMRASLKRLDQLKDEEALLEMHKAFRTDIKGELQFVDVPAKELVGVLPKAGEA
ncbi:hypothetical protein MCOR27_010192 [Pyricularia oryzae]|uniref:Ubiquinol-cytochrome c chaperone domain-containing protein n=2 Tax=Pyricularia TaxID=48558 RepID=A0ABQ8NUY8_PYRGI|nr:hypothetical protein MCOR01_010883 [Pyricularia oryzae]KAI6301983.1 hypothetical protein MCOR33_002605 [Pyricularia grisea]KAH9438087.1 hypothetical protein MCOR02_001728 [Pyricularia oryzae]KAI6258527.1 hypothetical protein MCOR19_005114 [Pyricularia oryzae]KAI6265437.1 hypothetical protein MCOR26_010744 [Pyricularia oryzae]